MKKHLSLVFLILAAAALVSCGSTATDQPTASSDTVDPYVTPVYDTANPPVIQNRVHEPISKSGLEFNDASGDGTLQPYEDWRLSPAERAADLIDRISLDMKIGLLSAPGHASVTADGTLGEYDDDYKSIVENHLRYGLIRLSTKPIITATYHDAIQELTQSLEWGIPYIVSADPLHGASTSNTSNAFSLWPEQLGFGAANDPALTRKFAEMAAEEYRALGIRMALHPMADTVTDPRWARAYGTFGSGFDLNAIHTVEYIKGFQGGDRLLPSGVITTAKHFVGYGAGYKGYDGHYMLGGTAVFEGDNFMAHTIPFEAAFREANVAAVMPMYPIPLGITDEQVPGGFNRELMIDLGREELGFTGFYTSDWAIYGGWLETGWGMLGMNMTQRVAKSLNAGMNTMGGSDFTANVKEAIELGYLEESVVSDAAERVLKAMFAAGLFENPYSEMPESDDVFTAHDSEHWQAGLDAMHKSMVLLKNVQVEGEAAALPASSGMSVYFSGNEAGSSESGRALLESYGVSVIEDAADIASADVAIIRINGPSFEAYADGGNWFFVPQSRSLTYVDEVADSEYGVEGVRFTDRYGNTYEDAQIATDYAELQAIYDARDAITAAGSDTKLIVVVDFRQPWIVSEYLNEVDGLIATFGAVDEAVLDMIFAKDDLNFTAHLPFQISRSNAVVESTLEDLSDDDRYPQFNTGFGLSY